MEPNAPAVSALTHKRSAESVTGLTRTGASGDVESMTKSAARKGPGCWHCARGAAACPG